MDDQDETDTGSLVVRSELSTTDVDIAEDLLRRGYAADSKLTITGVAQEFTFSQSSLAAPGFVISRPRFGVSLSDQAVIGPDDPLVVIQPVSNHIAYVETTSGNDAYAGAGDVVLAPPTGSLRVISERLDAVMVALDRSAVGAYAAAMTGLEPDDLTFAQITPRTPGLGRCWADTVAHVRDHVLGNPWAAGEPILLAQAFQTLAAALLSTMPNSAFARATDPEEPPVRGDVPAARLREVVDYLDTHADQPIGPVEIAELAGRPASEIVEGLRRRRGTHPAELLWTTRLRGVRRDLLDADPHSTVPTAQITQVARIAARWGFTRPGRFRIAYQRAFDETPEHTLRR